MNTIIDDKSKAFAFRIIGLYDYLYETQHETVLAKQILRSGTSIGANIRERKNAQTNADFITKLHIALKEADETQYWLELLVASEKISQSLFDSLNNDLREIIAMLTSSIKTTKENNNYKK